MRSSIVYAFGILTSVGVLGCAATESEGFRRMAAVDHERAAASGADDLGATPAEHLEAARRLRGAERFACAEVPDRDRDEGLLAMRNRIVAIEAVRDKVFPKAPPQLVGVRIDVRATPGVTEQWIGRIIDCHVAHYAVVGAASAPPSPLLVQGTEIRVSSTSDGFRVSVTSKYSDVAREVLNAGRALAASGT
jgi:hypothetical protein